jgi:hypothetical protein
MAGPDPEGHFEVPASFEWTDPKRQRPFIRPARLRIRNAILSADGDSEVFQENRD